MIFHGAGACCEAEKWVWVIWMGLSGWVVGTCSRGVYKISILIEV